jgi:hypothetical protein
MLGFTQYLGEQDKDDDNDNDHNEDPRIYTRPKDVADDLTTGDSDQQDNEECKRI